MTFVHNLDSTWLNKDFVLDLDMISSFFAYENESESVVRIYPFVFHVTNLICIVFVCFHIFMCEFVLLFRSKL